MNGRKHQKGPDRGNSARRKARKHWLLSPKSGFGGNKVSVPCIYCGLELTYETVESDRIIAGGRYVLDNVVPACRKCNAGRGNKTIWQYNSNVARRLVRMGKIVSPKKQAA